MQPEQLARQLKNYRIIVTLPQPVDGSRTCEFSPEVCTDAKGYFIKWGCWWPANFWFTTSGLGPNVGNHLYHAQQTLLRKLNKRLRDGATIEVVQVED